MRPTPVQAKPAPDTASRAEAGPELVLPAADTRESAGRDTQTPPGPGAQGPAERPLAVIPSVPEDATTEDVAAIRARIEEIRERAPDDARFLPARAQGQEQAAWPVMDGLDASRMELGVKLTESAGSTEIRVGAESVRIQGDPKDENGRYAYTIYEQDDGQATTPRTFAVHIVAAPGVRIDSTAGRLAHASQLTAHTVRVQDPRAIPPQGTRFRKEHFESTTVLAPEAMGPLGLQPPDRGPGARVHTGATSATIEAELEAAPGQTGERQRLSLNLSVPALARDARFAYQLVQDEAGAVSEIRVVAGPAVAVALTRPSARAWHRPQMHMFRVDDPALVPAQGSPIDPSFFAASGRPLEPDREQVARSPREALQQASVDITLSAVPIVGELVDLGELVWAGITGRDRWGREVRPWQLAVLGVGVLLPFVGGAALRSADQVAGALGRSADDIAPILDRVQALAPADRELVRKWNHVLREGKRLPTRELAQVQRIFDALVMSPVARQAGQASPSLRSALRLVLDPEGSTKSLRASGAVPDEVLTKLGPEELHALDVVRQGLPPGAFTRDFVEGFLRVVPDANGNVRQSPLMAIYVAGVRPDDLKGLRLTKDAGPGTVHEVVTGGRRSGAPADGLHALLAGKLHDWQTFRQVADGMGASQRGIMFEHWVRKHMPWASSWKRVTFDAERYGLQSTRVADIYLGSDGHLWELKYYHSGSVPKGQARDLASLRDEIAPDGTTIQSVRYLFPSQRAAEANVDYLQRIEIEVYFIDKAGVLRELP